MAILIELPDALEQALRAWAQSANQTEEQVICDALAAYLEVPGRYGRKRRRGRQQEQRPSRRWLLSRVHPEFLGFDPPLLRRQRKPLEPIRFCEQLVGCLIEGHGRLQIPIQSCRVVRGSS
jgi:hypothetical protein